MIHHFTLFKESERDLDKGGNHLLVYHVLTPNLLYYINFVHHVSDVPSVNYLTSIIIIIEISSLITEVPPKSGIR